MLTIVIIRDTESNYSCAVFGQIQLYQTLQLPPHLQTTKNP
jgi:hypothetical protein